MNSLDQTLQTAASFLHLDLSSPETQRAVLTFIESNKHVLKTQFPNIFALVEAVSNSFEFPDTYALAIDDSNAYGSLTAEQQELIRDELTSGLSIAAEAVDDVDVDVDGAAAYELDDDLGFFETGVEPAHASAVADDADADGLAF
eukprot:tig00000139_g8320.t1